jgi:hypothetical protein
MINVPVARPETRDVTVPGSEIDPVNFRHGMEIRSYSLQLSLRIEEYVHGSQACGLEDKTTG